MAHAFCCGHGDKLSTEHQDVSTTAACPAPSIRRVKLVYAMSHVSSVRFLSELCYNLQTMLIIYTMSITRLAHHLIIITVIIVNCECCLV
jgi:hypothetical protein